MYFSLKPLNRYLAAAAQSKLPRPISKTLALKLPDLKSRASTGAGK
jgi:hypothetical protein